MGGIMDLTGEPGGSRQKPGVAYADIFTGLYAVTAIQAALLQREQHRRRARRSTWHCSTRRLPCSQTRR